MFRTMISRSQDDNLTCPLKLLKPNKGFPASTTSAGKPFQTPKMAVVCGEFKLVKVRIGDRLPTGYHGGVRRAAVS
jgi:hypothetical protein